MYGVADAQRIQHDGPLKRAESPSPSPVLRP